MRILKTMAFGGAMLLATSTFAQGAGAYGTTGTTGSSMGQDSTTNGLNTGIAPGPENGDARPGYGAAARGSSGGMNDSSGNSGTADSYGTGSSGTSMTPAPADTGAGMGATGQDGANDTTHSGMSGTSDTSSMGSSGMSDNPVTVASGGPGEAQRQAAMAALYGDQPYQSHMTPALHPGDLPDFGSMANHDNDGALGGYRP